VPRSPGSLVEQLAGLLPGYPIDDAVAVRLAAIAARWPAHLGPIASAVASACSAGSPPPAIGSLQLDDLALATAAGQGDPRAVAGIDALYAPVAARAIAAVRGAKVIGDDVAQRVRAALLAGAPPSIRTYAGRSPLAAWLRVITTREAVRLVRVQDREVSLDDERLVELISPEHDPELAYMKRHYREQLGLAFREAVADLPSDVRTLLRQSVVDGVGIDRLATLYDLHRATVARRIEAARRELNEAVRTRLVQRLGIDGSELASVLRLIESQLDVTLGALAGRARRQRTTRR
jgi:RNA polymerase sigma-70 factor (ECF subfamily)